MPLRNLALGLAVLANPSGLNTSRAEACHRLIEVARAHPNLIAGTHERFCTDLVAATDGRIFAKIGAEGVYVFGAVGEGLGFAGKVDDGNPRGLYRIMLELLTTRGLLTADELDSLEPWASPTIRNWAGHDVGTIEVSRD